MTPLPAPTMVTRQPWRSVLHPHPPGSLNQDQSTAPHGIVYWHTECAFSGSPVGPLGLQRVRDV